MQPSRNFDDLKSLLFTAAFCCGEAVVRFWMVCTGNDWRGAGATDAGAETGPDWIGLLGAGTLAGLFVGTSCLVIFPIKSDGAKCSSLISSHRRDIGGDDVCLIPRRTVGVRVLIGIVIGADYPIATSMIPSSPVPVSGHFPSALSPPCGCRRDLRRSGRLLAL